MKASIKFREDNKPIIKAKIPITILGLPFLTSVSSAAAASGDPKDLRFDVLTAFPSFPSLRASYNPNDPSNPFSLSLRTSVGSVSMTAEYNNSGKSGSIPKFMVVFKPKFGDFSFKKVSEPNRVLDSEDPTAVWVEKARSPDPWGVGDLVTGVEVTARSVVPVRGAAEVRFRWGVRLPAEIPTAEGGFSFNKLPMLVMNKISIVHVSSKEKEGKKKDDDVSKGVGGDVAEVRRQLEMIRAENGTLRKAVEEISREWAPLGGGADVSRVGATSAAPAVVGEEVAGGK